MSFCVKCGQDIEKAIDGLCIDCFLDGRKLTTMPHHVDLQMCANCSDIKFGNRWLSLDLNQAIEDAAIDSIMAIKEARVVGVGASASEQDPHTFVVVAEITLDIEGVVVEDTSATIVRLKNTVCKRCSRQLGNYYEAILQIRADSKGRSQRIMRKALNRVVNLVDSQSISNRQLFITKTEEVQGGIDVYLSSISLGKTAAKDLSDNYCAETKEASKLVGQTTDGQDMYRVTYLVRLPEFHEGDVVIFEGRYFKLIRVSNNGAKVVDLMNFRERSVGRSSVHDLKVYESAEDLKEVTVISHNGNEIQILHPSNYSTVDLKVSDDAEIGETVNVVDIDDVLYYVP